MLKAIAVVNRSDRYDFTLTLPFELRQKSRLRAVLDNGDEVGLFLSRGIILRGGDHLETETGEVILIQAAAESVSVVKSEDSVLFSKACYHLGNRHVPLQISEDGLRYLHDHVLDDMVRGLGLEVGYEQASFEPEGGAYAEHSQHSHHQHDHHSH